MQLYGITRLHTGLDVARLKDRKVGYWKVENQNINHRSRDAVYLMLNNIVTFCGSIDRIRVPIRLP